MKRMFFLAVSVLLSSSVFAFTNDEVKALIDKTVTDISKDAPGTFAKINKGEAPYKKDELYVFVYDMDVNMIAHFDPALVGKALKGKPDACGCFYRDEILNRINKKVGDSKCKLSDKESVNYVYKNPKTGKIENKIAFFKPASGSDGKKYVVISGNYVGEMKACENN